MSDPLKPGTKLGRYDIRSKIGAGGMGEVYRAHDEKLNRDVAIKVLASRVSPDVERLRRFEQEAQAVGSLNHPNILAIYDVGEHEGAPYVVSELLAGETLRDKLHGTPLSHRKAIDYASQIARGLSVAHSRGIVHRDLKPENIFITQEALAKILDFGLAKLFQPTSAAAQTDVPTRRVKTDPGTVMGTVGYMSPEQVRAQTIDHRSDIFSFGAVMYEMLSGKRAFRGDSAADTVSAILNEDPPDLSATNHNISPTLERIVRRCLEKNPAQRFQSASDLAFDLENISGTSNQTGTATVAGDTSFAKKRRVWPAVVIVGTFVVVAAAFAAGFLIGRKSGLTAPPIYQQTTFRRGMVRNARFFPDGQTIIYSAAWGGNPFEIFTSRAGSTEPRSLGLKNAELLAVSSAGELAVLLGRSYLGESVSRGTLARMPIEGGSPREVLENVQEADWSPDGTKLAIVRWVNGINRLEYPIGKVLYETRGYIAWLRISPKGDMVAFMDHQIKYDNRGWVCVVDSNGNKKDLTNEWGAEEGLTWSPNGDEIWFGAQAGSGESNALYAVTLDGRQRVVARGPTYFWPFDISREGRVLLSRQDLRIDAVGLAPGETKERNLSWMEIMGVRDFSADGKTFTFCDWNYSSSVNYQAYLGKTDGSPPVNLGEGDPWGISPDGKWVLTLIHTPPHLVLLPTGAGDTKRLQISGIENFGRWLKWFPDGKRILFNGKESGHDYRMYVYEIDGGNPRPVTPEGVVGGVISPDGESFIATDPQGTRSLFSISGGQARPITGLDDDVGRVLQWGSDGRSVYAYRYDNQVMRVFRVDLATGRRELFKEITPADPAGIINMSIAFTPDGKSYLYTSVRTLSTLYVVDGLK